MDSVYIVIKKGRLFDECAGAFNADVWGEEEIIEHFCEIDNLEIDEFGEHYAIYYEVVR